MKKRELFADIFFLRERMNKLFEDTQIGTGKKEVATWLPVIDIYETPSEFVVNAELPEIKESDITIQIEDNNLRISGERRLQREGRNYYQVERSYGVFSRTFVLPEDVNQSAIQAVLHDGILKIRIPKSAQELAKHIGIG
ncbi:MAG: Hsp20/alpha crystallin family protein [Dissulfurispiraceae bacterium]